jgi:prepilin signal peptidase PulO-like enzyme (type II secretory pathway)
VSLTAESLLFSAAGAVAGWLVGLLSATLTDRLLAEDGLQSASRGVLVRDPLVQGAVAVAWALVPLVIEGPWWRWLGCAALAVPLIQVAVTDLRHRYVYTVVAGVGLLAGLLLGWLVQSAEWWTAPLGALAGLVSFAAIYGLGRLLYRGEEPLARGDVTIATMVGAISGPAVLTALVLGVVFSGLVALGVLLTRRSRQTFMPYGPGLCLGGLVTLFLR